MTDMVAFVDPGMIGAKNCGAKNCGSKNCGSDQNKLCALSIRFKNAKRIQ